MCSFYITEVYCSVCYWDLWAFSVVHQVTIDAGCPHSTANMDMN